MSEPATPDPADPPDLVTAPSPADPRDPSAPAAAAAAPRNPDAPATEAPAPASPFPRFVVVTVVVLALALVGGAVAIALLTSDDGPAPAAQDASTPLALPEIPNVAADSAACASLVAALPATLTSGTAQLDRRPLAEPAPLGAAAWGVDDPVVLRCGLDQPAELTQTAQLVEIDSVRWLHLPDPDLPRSTYVAVDRPVYVALTLANDSGTGPLQGVSRTIAATLPAQPVDAVG